ncbi:hypothetical protein ZONE111905_06080 [Zobellia nedashkovskayae]
MNQVVNYGELFHSHDHFKNSLKTFLYTPTQVMVNSQQTLHLPKKTVSVKAFSLANNVLMASVKNRGELSYSVPLDQSVLPAGVYAVLLEIPYGQTLRKVIIK